MSKEKDFEKLFLEAHDYLFKAHELRFIYIPKKSRNIIKNYKESLFSEMHLIKPLLKKYPHLKKSLQYKPSQKNYEKAYKIYKKTLRNPPKNVDRDQICIYNLLYQSIDTAYQYERITKEASKITVLEQSLVAMCTAYECYARESLQWILNNSLEQARRYIGSLSVYIKEFGKYNFEPIRYAGDVFNERDGQNFKIFENGKEMYTKIIGFNIFKNKKIEMKLWKIFQTRHCIIHNGGKPDLSWKRKTKNAKFKKDASTLNSYIIYIHNQFHGLFYRLYTHLFNKKPKLVKECDIPPSGTETIQ